MVASYQGKRVSAKQKFHHYSQFRSRNFWVIHKQLRWQMRYYLIWLSRGYLPDIRPKSNLIQFSCHSDRIRSLSALGNQRLFLHQSHGTGIRKFHYWKFNGFRIKNLTLTGIVRHPNITRLLPHSDHRYGTTGPE